MEKPTLTLALILSLFIAISQSARSETVADRLEWPPVFERSYGTPKVVVRETDVSCPEVVFIRPARLVIVKTACGCTSGQIDYTLRKYFLGLLWDDYLSSDALSENEVRLNMGEIIPISRQTFDQIGQCQLAGKSSGNCVYDAWWKVRTGMKLKESCDHLLAITTLEWDDPDRINNGHYAFALRQRGGNTSTDSLYDFRAPWHEDRRPRISEAPNIHNLLKLRALRENLYDWLYTQTEYRNSHVTMSFVTVYEEQITLLRAYNGHIHEAGNFRVLKKNCASLGMQFVNRLLPLDDRVKGADALADIPRLVYESTVEHFGGAIVEVKIDNYTLKVGREPTSRSKIHSAQPGRKGSRPFRILSEIPEIN